MNSDIVSLIIILICVMLSAYFSATETSFTSLNRIRMKNMAEKGDKRAELVLKLLENFDKLLSTILVGNNIVNIGLSSLATVLFIKLLGGDSGATVSTIVTTIVVLIFGEVSPKSIAKESPETIAKFSAPFLHILMIMLTPVTFLFSQWKKLLSRIFKSSENHGITDEELMTIVEEATQEGDINDQEGDLIQNAIGFMEMEAAEIFTPRVNVIGIPLDATKSEIAKTFSDTGFSRLPVYDDDIDHIVGYIHSSELFHNPKRWQDHVRTMPFVPETMQAQKLMQTFLQQKKSLGVVVDEFGGTSGLVSLEDIVEEIFGDIEDEHDSAKYVAKKTDDGDYLLSARLEIDKINDMFDLDLPESDEYMTLGGLILHEYQSFPKLNEVIKINNFEFKIIKSTSRKIELVKLHIIK